VYPLSLLTGTALVIVAAALHPDLTGDGAAQLEMVARMDAWRAIHWAFLFGFVLSLVGLAGLAGMHVGTPGEGAARAGVTVGVLAYGAWSIVVAYMAGSGYALARSYVAAEPGLAATGAVFLYDMTHPFALAAQRLGAFALGASTSLLGWSVAQGRRLPRAWGWAGAAAGLVAMGLAAGFGEATKADQAAFVLPVLWQAACALRLLAGRTRAA
jgi:hypothetical protein